MSLKFASCLEPHLAPGTRMEHGDGVRDSALDDLVRPNGRSGHVLPSTDRERFLRLAEATRAALWEFDFATRRLTIDPSPHQILGYSAAELREDIDAYWRLLDPADRDMAITALAAHLKGEAPEFVLRCRLRARNGRTHWFHVRAVVQCDAVGQPLRLQGSSVDITRLKSIETDRRRTRLRYRSLFYNLPVSTWIEDYTAVDRWVRELRARGVSDLRAHLAENPSQIAHAMSLVKVREVNDASLALLGAENRSQLMNSALASFRETAADAFLNGLVAYWEGHTFMETRTHALRLDGKRIGYSVRLFAPIDENKVDLKNVFVLLFDTDDRRFVEQALLRVQAELEHRVAERTAALEAANEQLRIEAEERRRIAAALSASEERLQSILDNTTAVVYMKDREGRYLLVNRQYVNIFKLDGTKVIGRTDAEFMPAATAQALRENDLRVLATGENLEFEETVQQEDGQEHTYISVKFPVRDAEGRITAVGGVSTDISDRKRAEQALRESEARYRLLAEHSTDIVSRHGPDLVTKFVSPASKIVLGYEPEEFVGLSAYEYVHPADIARVVSEQTSLRAGNQTYQVTFRARHRDGHYLWLECHGRGVIDPQTERVREIINHARDITERQQQQERMKALEDQLAHVNRLSTLGEMASGLAHELNQPLGAIANYAETSLATLSTALVDPAPLRKDMEQIVRLTSRCASIIRHLRSFVKRAPGVRVEADLAQLVEEVVEFVKRDLHAAEVALHLAFAERPLWAVVDPIQIQQVVLNLLHNALEATLALPASERRIEIVCSRIGDERLELRVSNTTLPISRQQFERVFEPFFTTKAEGLGLGLTISESIATSHGGTLTGTIEADDSITFRLELPRRGESHARE